jgi:hypothetical protein
MDLDIYVKKLKRMQPRQLLQQCVFLGLLPRQLVLTHAPPVFAFGMIVASALIVWKR